MASASSDASDIIISGISNICSKAGLNAEKFRLNRSSNKLCWNAECGIIGKVKFNIQYSLLEENLTEGLKMVSTIIAFTDLLTKEENRRFTENIMRAHMEYRSPCYFRICYPPSSNTLASEPEQSVATYVPLEMGNFYGLHTYLTIYVNYTFNPDTGEYSWVIPDTPEVPVGIRLNHDEMTGMLMTEADTLNPPEFLRGAPSGYGPVHLPESARVGLERGFSSGIPVNVATQIIEDSLTPYRSTS